MGKGQDYSNEIYHYQDQLLSSGIRFPNTWIELDWVDGWNFDNDIFFREPHFRNTFRRFFLSQVVKMVDKLVVNGDNVEFGVYYGYGSKIILDNSKKDLHLIDSFEGLSNPDMSDGNSWKSGDMSVPLAVVTQNLKAYTDRIKVHRGWIPDVFEHTKIETIAFAHIDVDLYMPTLKSLEFTGTKLQIGGMIICDDYGFSSCPGATKACEDFIEKNPNFSLLPLPVGGALIFVR